MQKELLSTNKEKNDQEAKILQWEIYTTARILKMKMIISIKENEKI